MSNVNTGGAAFPSGLKGEVKLAGGMYSGAHVPEYDAKSQGITIRDYFAAKAMQALITSMHEHDINEYSDIAHDAYLTADAMLAERERGE